MKPPLKPGQVLDPDSLYAKAWSGKPTLIKLKDNLVLQVPPQFHQFWAQRHWLTGRDMVSRPPMPLDKIPTSPLAGFVMHLPDFEGYTPDNYERDFDENRVQIVHIAPAPMSYMESDASGSYPPNQFKRASTGQYRFFDPDKYEEKYGLRCFEKRDPTSETQYCYGKRDSDFDEYLLLDVMFPPYDSWVQYPQMQTKYFSPKYGGLEIIWRSNMKNFPRWREIDAQIWKYIDAWNIAPKNASPATPQSTTAR